MPPDDPRLVADAAALGAQARALAEAAAAEAPPGDFEAMVRRAAALAETKLSAQDVEEAAALAGRSDEELVAGINFGTVEDFLDDAAAFVAGQTIDEIPPMRGQAPEPPRRRPVAVLLLAAAVVLVTIGVGWLGQASWRARSVGSGEPSDYSSAADRVPERPSGTATPRRKAAAARTPKSPEPSPSAVPVPPAESLPPDADATAGTAGAAKATGRRTGRSPRAPSQAERLAALDAEARAAWERGDLARAQEKFEALVRAGGRRSLVDIAYGDLFSLARQRGDTRALRGYWRRYAKKFPRGRYIDDARAGLCRTTAPTKQRPCWEAYLRDRPRGTYHQHARDVVSRPE